jgi:hypothetical protein
MLYYHLAQVNIARARAPLGAPLMAPFVERLDEINALAERHPGFVWRLRAQPGTTSYVTAGDPRLIVNMSIWESVEALQGFVFRTDHAGVMRRRSEWFEPMTKDHLAIWWIPAGHRPTLGEARERIAHLRARGDGPAAFTFRRPFPMPDQPSDPPAADPSAAPVSYEGLAFRSLENPHGEVDGETRFFYRQAGSRVWAIYRGGAIAFGSLVAAAAADGRLDMRYQHVNRAGDWREGRCHSTPEHLPDGRLRLHESWRWTAGADGEGQSTVEQLPDGAAVRS